MNYTICERIIARAKSELQKAEIFTSTSFNSAINGNIVRLHIDDEAPDKCSGWIIIVAVTDHLTIMFGNLITEKNFACFAVKPQKFDKHFWVALCKEILGARLQREKLLNNHTAVSIGNNSWQLYNLGDQNG